MGHFMPDGNSAALAIHQSNAMLADAGLPTYDAMQRLVVELTSSLRAVCNADDYVKRAVAPIDGLPAIAARDRAVQRAKATLAKVAA